MRKLATLQQIHSIKHHPNADRLDLVEIKGWTVVTLRDEFTPGDWGVYFEIDSYLPEYPEFEFLRKSSFKTHPELGSGYRIKTQKLRGIVSQGLLIPVHTLFPYVEGLPLTEDTDVTEIFQVQKWEAPIPIQLQGFVEGMFPSFLRKTDQERIENIAVEVFQEHSNDLFEVSLKLDGSSCTSYYLNGKVGVCSRNFELKLTEENSINAFVRAATDSKLLSALVSLQKPIAVSAELMGPGIQGNRENLTKLSLFVFDIWDIEQHRYCSQLERQVLFTELQQCGFIGEHVPVLDSGKTLQELGIIDVAASKVYVDKPSLNSPIAEGCVFKRIDGQYSFKSINNKYLLKFE